MKEAKRTEFIQREAEVATYLPEGSHSTSVTP